MLLLLVVDQEIKKIVIYDSRRIQTLDQKTRSHVYNHKIESILIHCRNNIASPIFHKNDKMEVAMSRKCCGIIVYVIARAGIQNVHDVSIVRGIITNKYDGNWV